jgi:uncharacterized linocin/CFP29 family protein
MEKSDMTIEDLAKMMKGGFDEIGQRFDVIENDLGVVKQDVSTLKQDVNELKNGQDRHSSEIASLRLDIGSLRTEMHDGFMKTNDKVDLLVVKLSDKKVITKSDAKEIISINPVSIS